MTEEFITKKVIDFLKNNNYTIYSYDFPQSGTGVTIHENNEKSKTNNSIVPDIIAYKNDVIVFFENKVKYYPYDLEKLNKIKDASLYSIYLDKLFNEIGSKKIATGMAIQDTIKNEEKLCQCNTIDIKLLVSDSGDIRIITMA